MTRIKVQAAKMDIKLLAILLVVGVTSVSAS
jgi:hypothetical protein